MLGENELRFFKESTLKRPFYLPFIAFRLARHLAVRSAFLLLKASITALRQGTVASSLSQEEYFEFLTGLIGFEPGRAECQKYGMKFRVESHLEFCIVFYHLLDVVFRNQYNISRENIGGKTVVDAGANIGIFAVFAARMGARKIYAFEPVKANFRILKRNIRENRLEKIIHPVNLAMGEKDGRGKISFKFDSDSTASIAFFNPSHKIQNIRIVSLDSFLRGKGRIGFIKIDTEGFEAEILKGAKNTLLAHKPILCFSAYHKPEDRHALPALVKSLRKDYSCTLIKRGEEDLYCE